jgi:glycosyltransferase involved in cell wall biosynthesis
MKRKVLILDNSIAATGAFNSIYIFSNALKNQFQFTFGITKKSILKDRLASENFQLLELPFLEIQRNYRILFYFPVLIYNSIKTAQYLKRNHIDIIHVNDLYNMTGVFIKIFNPGLFLIYHIRLLNNSYVSFLYRLWGKLINKFADQIICVSGIVADSFPFDPNKTRIIYDSVDVKKIRFESKSPINRELIELYYIGNYIQGKGQDLALEAFSKAVKIKKNLRLTFIGGTLSKNKNIRFKNQLIKTSSNLGLSHLITFRDLSQNIEEDYSKADIILNFSENESFSMVCLEALAFGKPLIASESGGPEEIIDNNEDGILISNRDIDKMSDAIIKLSGNKDLMNKFSENGPVKVAEKFNVKINKEKLQKVYNQEAF